MPGWKRSSDLSHGIEEKRTKKGTHSNRGVPDGVAKGLFLAFVPHGRDEGECRGDAGFGDAKEEALSEKPLIGGNGGGADGDTAPEEHDNSNIFADGEALGQVHPR